MEIELFEIKTEDQAIRWYQGNIFLNATRWLALELVRVTNPSYVRGILENWLVLAQSFEDVNGADKKPKDVQVWCNEIQDRICRGGQPVNAASI